MKTMKSLARFVIIPLLLLVSFAVTGWSSAIPSASAACPVIPGYPTFGFDTGRSSYNPSECIISPLVAPPLNWVSPLALPVAPREGISTDNVQGYVGQGNALVAFLLATGAPAWGFATPNPIVGSATVYLGKIYFGNMGGIFYALNPAGGLVCAVALGGSISTTPIGFNNTIVVSNGNGTVFGINAANCAVMWVTPVLGLTVSSPSLSANIALVSVQVNPAQSIVMAINALTGAILGNSPALPGTFTPPAVVLNQIYVGDSNAATSVIDFALVLPAIPVNWIQSAGGEPVNGKPAVDVLPPPAVAPNQVYVVSATTGRLFALNAVTGAINWAAVAPCGPLFKAAAPTVANQGVYVGGNKCMDAFKTAGGATWGLAVGILMDSPATVINGRLLFTANVGAVEHIFSF